jgi:hypothetical protein
LDLALLGMGGCKMLVSPDVGTSVFSQPGGTLDWRVNIPPSATLIGATFFNQAWVLDQLANNLGIATSNGGEGVVGF